MRGAEEWSSRDLGENSVLVMGWRKNRRLHACRLKLASSMDAELRSRAVATLAEIGTRTVRHYEQTAQLEEDEVFLLEVGDLPARQQPTGRRRGSQEDGEAEDQQAEVSAMIALLSAPGELDPLDADDARDRSFLFYAIVFMDDKDDDVVAFLKRHNSASVLRTGLLLGQWGQTVTRVDQPVLVFAQDFDLVIDGEAIASLKADAIQRLFADIEIAGAAVPALVKQLSDLPKIAFSPTARDTITEACRRRRLLARRLQQLLAQPHLADLTPAKVKRYLERTGQDPNRLIEGNRIVVSDEDVAFLLDVLGQAHYRGGYDDLLRRADRSSLVPGHDG